MAVQAGVDGAEFPEAFDQRLGWRRLRSRHEFEGDDVASALVCLEPSDVATGCTFQRPRGLNDAIAAQRLDPFQF
jgi:hypothetical protein